MPTQDSIHLPDATARDDALKMFFFVKMSIESVSRFLFIKQPKNVIIDKCVIFTGSLGLYSSKSWVLFTNEKNITERSKKLLTGYFPSQMEPQKELHYLFQVKDTYSWKKWRIHEQFRRSQYLPEPTVVPGQKSPKYIISYFGPDVWDHAVLLCSVLNVFVPPNKALQRPHS